MSNVDRAMHGKYIPRGQQEIHDAENRFLHLPGVRSSADQDGAPHEIEKNKNFGIDAVALGIGLELRSRDDCKLRLMISQFLGRRTQEQLPHKQVVPGILIHHADRQAISGVGAAKKILYIKLASAQMFHDARIERVKLLGFEWSVDRAPRYRVRRHLVFDDELVFGGASGAVGVTDDGTV